MSAYEQGRRARRNGVSLKANPFRTLFWKRFRWETGWLDEDAAIEADPNLVP